MKSLSSVFSRYDIGSKGYLTPQELRCALVYFTGHKPSPVIFQRWKTQFGSKFSLQDFERIYSSQIQPNVDERIMDYFEVLDCRGEGFISFEVFDSLCDRYLKHTSIDIRKTMFNEVDLNSDGRVTLKDFERLMRLSNI